MTVWLRQHLPVLHRPRRRDSAEANPLVVNMSDLEAIVFCFGAILWGLSGEGGPAVQALTVIALLIFFWFMLSSSGDDTGSASYASTRSSETMKASKIYAISPGRIDGYGRLIGYMGFHGSRDEPPITSIEEGISRFERIKQSDRGIVSDAKNFFSSPYVIQTLGFGSRVDYESIGGSHDPEPAVGGKCTVSGCQRIVMFNSDVCYKHRDLPDHSKKIGDDWWEKGYAGEEGKAPPKNEPDSESCGNPWCSNPVSAFDFRCFTCRRRFCSEHAGPNIECNDCSK